MDAAHKTAYAAVQKATNAAVYTQYPKRGPDASFLLICLAVALGSLIIVGARGQIAFDYPTTLVEVAGDVLIGLALPLLFIFALICISVECRDFSSLSMKTLIPAVMLSFSVTTAYCLMSSTWRNGYQKLFWVMGSIPLGAIMEVTTGSFKACTRWIELLNAGVKPGQKQA